MLIDTTENLPNSIKSLTNSKLLPYAAACSTVSPLLSTALMSAPCSNNSLESSAKEIKGVTKDKRMAFLSSFLLSYRKKNMLSFNLNKLAFS